MEFDRKDLAYHSKFVAYAGVASIFLYLVLPLSNPITGMIKMAAALGVFGFGWQFFWYSSTLIALNLKVQHRKIFEVSISLATPLVFAVPFFVGIEQTDPTLAVNYIDDWFIASLYYGLLIYLGWRLMHSNWANPEYLIFSRIFLAFRVFLGVALFFFLFSYWRHLGGVGSEEGIGFDKDKASFYAATGEQGIWYLLNVTFMYLGMTGRLIFRSL
jgi:hypothetical protein